MTEDDWGPSSQVGVQAAHAADLIPPCSELADDFIRLVASLRIHRHVAVDLRGSPVQSLSPACHDCPLPASRRRRAFGAVAWSVASSSALPVAQIDRQYGHHKGYHKGAIRVVGFVWGTGSMNRNALDRDSSSLHRSEDGTTRGIREPR